MDKERFQKQVSFILEADKEKNILRQTHLTGHGRRENDAEHAWHMAIMTFLLSEYANEDIDVLKTIRMILIHDIVEIDAGDTYAYDDSAKATQYEREERAANRLFGLLPEDQAKDLRALWDEFEAGESKEARFARTMDNVQPLLLNDATGGKAWEEHDVPLSKIMKRNERTAKGSEALWEYSRDHLIKKNVQEGHIIPDMDL